MKEEVIERGEVDFQKSPSSDSIWRWTTSRDFVASLPASRPKKIASLVEKLVRSTCSKSREEEEVIEEYNSDFDSNLSSPQLSEDEEMKSDVVVSLTLKTRNG